MAKYPIVVIEIPTPEEFGIFWQASGLEALAKAIAASIQQDLPAQEFGGIIEIPLREGVSLDGYQAQDSREAGGASGG